MILLLRRIAVYSLTAALALCVFAPFSLAATTTPAKIITSAKNIIVWQRFGQWLMITEDLSTGRVCYYYDPVRKSKLNLKEALPGSWMPLGSAIKWLMYVDYYQNQDRLMAHDVDWHAYYIAYPSNYKQVGCGMTGTTCVFGQYRANKIGDHYPVDLYNYNVQTGGYQLVCASSSEKSQFAHDGNLIVYRANFGYGALGIYGHYFNSTSEFEIAPRNGIEPSVCGSLVAWAEQSGVGYNIVAKDLVTGEIRNVAYTTANPPCPEAGQGSILWIDSRNKAKTGLDIYGYDWEIRKEFVVTNTTGDQTKLRVCSDIVTWVTGPTTLQTLWWAKIQVPVKVSDLRATQVTANSAQLAFTSVGSSDNPAVSYDLRIRTDGAISDSNWSTSTPVTGLPAPKAPGLTESIVLNNLAHGHYYIALKAKLNNGDYSLLSNCICVYVSTPQTIFSANEGAYVSFEGVVTGIGANSAIYCQKDVPIYAVKVEPSAGLTNVSVNQSISITGVLGSDSEFYGPVLQQCSVTSLGIAGLVKPVGIKPNDVGGYDSRFGGTIDKCAPNMWMLVRSWGRVFNLIISSSGCSFYINDGSTAGSGVHVVSTFIPPVELKEGSFSVVEGISGVSKANGREILVVESGKIKVYSN